MNSGACVTVFGSGTGKQWQVCAEDVEVAVAVTVTSGAHRLHVRWKGSAEGCQWQGQWHIHEGCAWALHGLRLELELERLSIV